MSVAAFIKKSQRKQKIDAVWFSHFSWGSINFKDNITFETFRRRTSRRPTRCLSLTIFQRRWQMNIDQEIWYLPRWRDIHTGHLG